MSMATWFMALKPALVGVALVAWWMRCQRFKPLSGLFGVQLFLAFIVESCATGLFAMRASNLWAYDLYVPVEFALLLFYVHGHLPHRWQRRYMWPALVAVGTAYVWDLVLHYPAGFVSAAYIAGSLVLVAALLAVVYELALRVDEPLYRQPLFWSHLGMALFFAGMVPLLGTWNLLQTEDAEMVSRLYIANHVLFALRYGGVVVACAVSVRKLQAGHA